MLKRDNTDSLIKYLAIAIALHLTAVLIYEIHRIRHNRVFMSVPIEVSFFTPSVQRADPAPVAPKEEPKKQQPKEEPPKKGDVAVKDKSKKPEKSKPVDNTPKTQQSETKPTNEVAGSQYGGLSLDTQDFKYAYYTNTVVRKIGRFWQWTESYGKLRAVVFFRILKNGAVVDIKVTDSSGDSGYDRNAARAIELASPFAPLPEDYEKDSLGVYFEFKYRN
ncbi:energy transducer TonB [Endomicrobium proavitum]|nr:TonB family protein [Endomicrobium proavitum]